MHDSFELSRTYTETADEITEEVAKNLEAHGRRPDRSRIKAIIESCCSSPDSIVHKSYREMGVLIWRVCD